MALKRKLLLGLGGVSLAALGFVALRPPAVTDTAQEVSSWASDDWSTPSPAPAAAPSLPMGALVGTNISLALNELGDADLAVALRADAETNAYGYKVVNFFGAWCAPCRVENPILIELADAGVEIVGIDYEDDPVEAARFLSDSGNPYSKILADPEGKSDFTLGISSIPQTLIVDRSGTVVWHRSGRLQEGDFGKIFHAVTGGPPPGMMASAGAPGQMPASGMMSASSNDGMTGNAMSMEAVTAGLAARLEREPGDIDGWILLARAYHELGQEGLSMSALAKARELAPDRADIPASYLDAPEPSK